MDAQADLSLRWAHGHFVGFVMRRLKYQPNLFINIIDRTESATQQQTGMPVMLDQTETGQGDYGIERLNLSNLSGETSDADTIPFKPTPHSRKLREQTTDTGGAGVHFQQQQLHKVDNFVQDRNESVIPQIIPQNLPSAQTNVPKLLTPADFMSKQDSGSMPKSEKISHASYAPSQVKDTDADVFSSFGNRQVVPDYHIHSETQSVASTPRVLCQSAEHSHPLTETYTLTSGNVREVTPRSVREVTPRSMRSGEGDTGHTSTQEVQKEIVQIRNRLKSFDQKKKKLR